VAKKRDMVADTRKRPVLDNDHAAGTDKLGREVPADILDLLRGDDAPRDGDAPDDTAPGNAIRGIVIAIALCVPLWILVALGILWFRRG
jgi:hypothetical protein